MISHYEALGVPRDATEEQIRDRFREMVRQSHPDRFQGEAKTQAEQRFQVLTEALNVLTNAPRRKAHDLELEKGREMSQDPEQVAKAYVARGVKYYKEGDYPGAAEAFDMAVKHNSANSKAHYYLALALMQNPRGQRQGIAAIEKAVALEPYNADYLKEAGKMCLKSGLKIKAEKYLVDALKWNTEDAELQAMLEKIRGKTSKGFLDSLFKRG